MYFVAVKKGEKRPIEDGWQKKKYSLKEVKARFPGGNIGILLGKASGGLVDIDLDCPEAIRAASYFLPDTRMVWGRTSCPQSHRIYVCPDMPKGREIFTGNGAKDVLLEIRGTGHQTITPFGAATHPSGEHYTWACRGRPTEIKWGILKRACSKTAVVALLSRHWPEGIRQDAAISLQGGLLRAGWPVEAIKELVEVLCDVAGDKEVRMRLKGLGATLKRMESGASVTGWKRLGELIGEDIVERVKGWLGVKGKEENRGITATERLTDRKMAEMMVVRLKGRLVYNHEEKAWIRYQKPTGLWIKDQKAPHIVYKHVLDDLAKKGVPVDVLEASGKENQVLCWLQKELTVQNNIFQSRRGEIVCGNGVLDLRRLKLRPHSPSEYARVSTPVDWNPEFEGKHSAGWIKFLWEITGHDTKVITWLQILFGRALAGERKPPRIVLFEGSGANGKSTMMDVIQAVVGGYGWSGSFSSFTRKSFAVGGGSPQPDIAALVGKRIVVCDEGERSAEFDMALLKAASSASKLTTRNLYESVFEFEPLFTIFFLTNNLPTIKDDSEGTWRRIRRYHFSQHFVEVRRKPNDKLADPGLTDRFINEHAEGILRWLAEGANAWYVNNSLLNMEPDSVRRWTSEYREGEDQLFDWISRCVEMDCEGRETIQALYDSYTNWASKQGVPNKYMVRINTFSKMLGERGFEPHRWKRGREQVRGRVGLRLKDNT